jgi:SAM-dependent methyltransferase
MTAPQILDIGCGSGWPTLELTRLSDGTVIGLDHDQGALDRLAARAAEAGLADRVQTVNRSLFDPGFPDGSFDVIWAEGSIHILGFERGLDECRRILRPGGFLVIHEMVWLKPDPPPEIGEFWQHRYPGIRTVAENLAVIARHGYRVVGHFALPEDFWWEEYFDPLEERIRSLRGTVADDAGALAALDREQEEIDLHRRNRSWYGSAFFVLKEMART